MKNNRDEEHAAEMEELEPRYKMVASQKRTDTNKKAACCGRTRLEIVLAVFLLLVCLCLIGLVVSIVLLHGKGKKGECVNQQCLRAASDLLESRDTSVDPCEDFYDYVCQKWAKDTIVTLDEHRDKFSGLQEDVNVRLKDLLEQEETPLDKLPEHFQKATRFYKACMNEEGRDQSGMIDFLADLEKLGHYPALTGPDWDPSSFNWVKTLKDLIKNGLDGYMFSEVQYSGDFKNNSMGLIMIGQPKMGMPSQIYFEREDLVEHYITFLTTIAEYICKQLDGLCNVKDPEEISKQIGEAVEVEKYISSISVSEVELADKDKIYNIRTIKELQEMGPEMDWVSLLKAYFPNSTETEKIMVGLPDFVQSFSKYIGELESSDVGKRTLANYMMYRVTAQVAPHLDKKSIDSAHAFLKGLTGDPDAPKQWGQCLTYTKTIFDKSLSAMYIRKYFTKETKESLEALMEDIRYEYKNNLMEVSWMDEDTRKEALNKLESLYTMAAYPEDILDDNKLNKHYRELIIGEDHYINYKHGTAFETKQQTEGHGKKLDRTSWKSLPAPLLEINAIYNANNNSIFVPIGILQEWFFEETKPKYMNYGRIGSIIAHEFGHAFDNQGKDFDSNGNWRNWWKHGTLKKFTESTKCMVDMFDKYTVPKTKLRVNGTLTLTENIADDSGIAEAYAAYIRATEKEADQRLPGIDLNQRQLFWVNMASVWCEKQTESHYEQAVTSDEHSPARFRVLSPLSNNEDFVNDFGCKKGSKMNRIENQCHVWAV